MAAGTLSYIPFNRGFQAIEDCTRTWDATYPELVLAVFDFQYIRPFLESPAASDTYGWTAATIRMQLKLELDGVLLPATGPHALAQDGKVRGTGFAGADLRSYVMATFQVPPGRHSVVAKAAIAPETRLTDESFMPIYEWRDNSEVLYPGPAFGHRKLMIIRQPYGLSLGA